MVSTKNTTRVKGYEKKEVNMVVLPLKTNLAGEFKTGESVRGIDISRLRSEKMETYLKNLIKKTRLYEAGEESYLRQDIETLEEEDSQAKKFSMFSQKKIKLHFPTLGIYYSLDLQNLTDHYLSVRGS